MLKKLIIFALCILLTSCGNFLDIQPTGKVIAESAEEYRAMLTDVYNDFPCDRSLTTLRTDEMQLDPATTTTEDLNSYFEIWTWNDVAQDENTVSFNWRVFYHTIYIANYLIEHQSEITNGTQADISQMVGEAYMLRAYSHFILVNLFGQPYTSDSLALTDLRDEPTANNSQLSTLNSLSIPLSLHADVEAVLSRNTVAEVYSQILADISSAEQYLNVDTWEDGLKYRFNKISASALRSRVCLYMSDWDGALSAAKAVIEKYPELEDLTSSSCILPDNYKSKEAIVCLEQVMKSAYKGIGNPNADFIKLYRTGDLRKTRYFKAQTSKIYTLLKGGDSQCRSTFRSAEFYLTAAEAEARLGHSSEAIAYLEPLIRTRYLEALQQPVIDGMQDMTSEELLETILNERARELCFEGHRWFDLRRTTQPSISKTYNETTYTLQQSDSRYTLPIPTEALNANPNLSNDK